MFKIIGGDMREYGPVTAESLRQWIAEGRANAQTKVLAEGTTEWTPLGTLPEFASAFSKPSAPPPILTQPPPLVPVAAVNISNYLVPAIFCTLCCCLPTGIVALVYAAQVNTKLAAGDIAGAMATARSAQTWCWVSVGLGTLSCLGFSAFNFLGTMQGRGHW
ncbi:MAG: CD225/dispanin family protein [Verrucomicrobia bacterium]|nr:CD225/dispanin family protein [Verrucomicrobiota bacterium]